MDAYWKGLNGVQAMWMNKKCHGHWVISLEALEIFCPLSQLRFV